MYTHSRMFQRAGGLGIVYALLFAAANFLIGNGPSTSASGASVVKYYHSHRVTETAGVFVVAVALVAFAFFLSSLRPRSRPDDRWTPVDVDRDRRWSGLRDRPSSDVRAYHRSRRRWPLCIGRRGADAQRVELRLVGACGRWYLDLDPRRPELLPFARADYLGGCPGRPSCSGSSLLLVRSARSPSCSCPSGPS